MPEIVIRVREKIAEPVGDPEIVCGNSDYTVRFDFDSEWGEEVRIARFVWQCAGRAVFCDRLFTGNTVSVPVLHGTRVCMIGAYAGNIRTTTAAQIPCIPVVSTQHAPPDPDIYAQLLEYLQNWQNGLPAPADAVLSADAVAASQVAAGGTYEEVSEL